MFNGDDNDAIDQRSHTGLDLEYVCVCVCVCVTCFCFVSFFWALFSFITWFCISTMVAIYYSTIVFRMVPSLFDGTVTVLFLS